MPEKQYATLEQHSSLTEDVKELTRSVSTLQSTFKSDMTQMQQQMADNSSQVRDMFTDQSDKIFAVMGKKEDRTQAILNERSKVPYPMLSLILALILAVGGALSWNTQRIEEESDTKIDKLYEYDRSDIYRRARMEEKVDNLQKIYENEKQSSHSHSQPF